jgi:hypothetical protein
LNPNPDSPNPRADALQAELDSVRRREAEFRANMVQEFLDRGERNTYLHTLREERAALVRRGQEASADLEYLVRKLEAEAERTAALEARLGRLWNSWSWRLTAPLRALGTLVSRGPGDAPAASPRDSVEGGIFTYYLHTSPFRVYHEDSFTLRGWAWPQDGRPVTSVRAVVDGRAFIGRCGLEEPEVIARHGPQQANPRPGFEVRFETPPGRHLLSVEAQLAGAEWRWIMRTSIWCEPGRP